MRSRRRAGLGQPGTAIVVLAILMTSAHAAVAQDPKPLAPPGARLPEVQAVEPLRCWRQSSAGAVTVGETFTVTLTCAVFESADAQVVPDESRLNVASIQMAPFEILGGAHPPDVRRGSRRFLQYEYQLRIISRDAIGQDVNVPPLTISYRVHSRVGAAAKLEGRDLSYLLPAMPIRVLSLVPADATDIRDSSEASLATVDGWRSRSRLFELLALALGALAAVTIVFALVPLARQTRSKSAAQPDLIPDRALLTRAAEALTDIQDRATRDGWTDDLVAEALGVVRLVAATAIGRSVSQRPLPKDGVVPEGRLLVRHGWVRPAIATVSSAVTPDDVGRSAVRNAALVTVIRGQHLAGLQSGLAALSAALYRQSPPRDAAVLNEAMRHAVSVAREVAAEQSWWSRLRRGSGGQETRWARH